MANEVQADTSARELWNEYARAASIGHAEFSVFRFGDSP
jgi:hypothetical protein